MLKNLKKYFYSKNKGTSLSETLITIALLGIVFTICTGVIVADYNKNQTIVRLKKNYSIFSSAINVAVSKHGNVDTWDIENGISEIASNKFFEEYLRPNLVLARDCRNSTHEYCNYNFKELSGVEKDLNSTWTRFYLNDGTFVAIQTISNEDYKVAYFYIDTNGKKRLNVVARDIFVFELWLKNDKDRNLEGLFLPYGHEYTREELISNSNENNCNNKMNGNYCASLIIKDNWQFKQGYPWAQARYVVK